MIDIEREAFEKWAMSYRDKYNLPHFVMRDSDGDYVDSSTAVAWEAWQAARQAPASGEVELASGIDWREKNAERVVRAFWRRIYPYRNDYGKELPDECPLEFKVHMATALCAITSRPPAKAPDVAPVAEVVSGYSGDPDTRVSLSIKPLDLSGCKIGDKLLPAERPDKKHTTTGAVSEWKNVCFECCDRNREIRDLKIRVADCEGAIERREQFIAQANSERDSALDAEVVAWAEVDSLKREVERLRGRVVELESQNEALRQQLQQFMTSELKTAVDYAQSFILRKQAEAIDRSLSYRPLLITVTGRNCIEVSDLKRYAQTLRQQADKLEQNQ